MRTFFLSALQTEHVLLNMSDLPKTEQPLSFHHETPDRTAINKDKQCDVITYLRP